MAPKDSSKGKGKASGESSGRKRARSSPEHPLSPQPSTHPLRFISPTVERAWPSYESRAILFGRPTVISDFAQFRIPHLLAQQFLTKFLVFSGPTYEQAVRLFYANLELLGRGGDYGFESLVFGTRIRCTRPEFAAILGVPDGGEDASRHTHNLKDFLPDHVSLTDFREEICQPGRASDKPAASDLEPKYRILHSIISFNIWPKAGNRDNVTFDELKVLALMSFNRPINLPELMIHVMGEARRTDQRVGKALPYGMWLTKVFNHYGVDLSKDSPTAVKPALDRHSLRRMKITHPPHGYTVRPPRAATAAPETEPEPEQNSLQRIEQQLAHLTQMIADDHDDHEHMFSTLLSAMQRNLPAGDALKTLSLDDFRKNPRVTHRRWWEKEPTTATTSAVPAHEQQSKTKADVGGSSKSAHVIVEDSDEDTDTGNEDGNGDDDDDETFSEGDDDDGSD